ncbi:glycosyltransferase involved in cell wall biosynthesis [Gillisia mitskevichiae]|uniref:Glycosyltransferase involved in cell wall biosynthesis n=1 Tax=Gillisia mitskevichiae TaxID=270921 RepID=A0A495PTY2_9FLAO|nr:glycosyltransferase family 4 protein [Gillisia mitskevichiae]RKS53012.1 glycosyltransferase involved in cell wall biosynthesis [Gillisia mitskevichiae]
MSTVLVIGYVWPEPNSSAAGKRMLQLLKYFTSSNYKVIFGTTAAASTNAANLIELGITAVKIELNNSSFDTYIQDLQPEIVLFDRFMMEEQFGWRISKNSPSSIKILDTEDLHFLRNYREKELKATNSITNSELAKREIASIYRCDLSLIISEVEINILKETFNISQNLLLYIPFLLENIGNKEMVLLPSFEERKGFLSIGNFKHKPNVDAIKYLKKEIWPLIRKELPNEELHIYGAYPTAAVLQLNNPKENFYIKGWAKDAEEVVKKSKVSLAALRFGAGLKGKLTEAMQCGTPSVTTSIGAEGMHKELPWNGFIENDPKAFAESAINLYTTKAIWQESQLNGFKLINELYNKEFYYKLMDQKLKDLKEKLSAHRENNFIGGMLMHHRLKSTQYLSKYIEVKTELETLKSSLNT